MDEEINIQDDQEFRRFFDRINALSCIRFLIIFEVIVKIVKVGFTGVVLYIKKDENLDSPLKLFLTVYMIVSLAKAITFLSKNRNFFSISSIPDFHENSDITLLNNFLEAIMLFWYIVGFHWLQECDDCQHTNPLIYYTAYTWIILGFLAFIAPLFAIAALLVLVAYIRPRLKVIEYQDVNDLPDDNNRCTICFEDYKPGTQIKFLPCDHHFHLECIDEWFNLRDSCPLCKRNINLLYDLVEPTEVVV